MNLIKLSGLLGLWVISNVAYAQPTDSANADQAMTLVACLEYAFQNNTTVQNAKLEQRIAATDVGVTKSQGLPQLSANASYDNNFLIQTQFLPAVFFAEDPNSVPEDAPPVPARFGAPHTGRAAVSLTQMIFDGSYFVGLKAARVYSELASKSVEQSKTVTAEQVTKAYYTALVNEERRSLLTSNFQRLDTLL